MPDSTYATPLQPATESMVKHLILTTARSRTLWLAAAATLLLILAACEGSPTPTPAPPPTSTAFPTATAAPTPTPTAIPTATAVPTSTPPSNVHRCSYGDGRSYSDKCWRHHVSRRTGDRRRSPGEAVADTSSLHRRWRVVRRHGPRIGDGRRSTSSQPC